MLGGRLDAAGFNVAEGLFGEAGAQGEAVAGQAGGLAQRREGGAFPGWRMVWAWAWGGFSFVGIGCGLGGGRVTAGAEQGQEVAGQLALGRRWRLGRGGVAGAGKGWSMATKWRRRGGDGRTPVQGVADQLAQVSGGDAVEAEMQPPSSGR